MRICIVGAGAIGGWVAARLALAGEEVMALTSRGPIDGLEITEAGETRRAEFRQFDGPAELLAVAVKATALGEITESVRPLIGPAAMVALRRAQSLLVISFVRIRIRSRECRPSF